MATKKKLNDNIISGLQNIGSNIKTGVQNALPQLKDAAADILSLPRQDTGLRGVSNNTRSQLNQYSQNYTPSESVNAALAEKQAANDALKNYGPYQSQYQGQLDAIFDKIMNRKDFTYDLNGDTLYNQYKDQYQALGQAAMADTMGQAAALTGGYGNSYAASVGNQAYQNYLSQLNDKVPELYQLALQKYQMDGQNMLDQYGMVANADDRAYGRYADQYNRLAADRDYYANAYNNERSFDYGQFADNRSFWQNQAAQENADYWQNREFNYNAVKDAANFAYGAYRDTVGDAWNALNFGYGAYRDTVADSQWNKTFDYNKSRDAVADEQWRETFDYGKTRDAVSDNQWQQTFDYNKARDAVSDSQWQQTFNYNKARDGVSDSQWEKEYALKKASAVSTGSGSGGGKTTSSKKSSGGSTKKSSSSGSTSKPSSSTTPKTTTAKSGGTTAKTGTTKSAYTGVQAYMLADVSSCVNASDAAKKIDGWANKGLITSGEADNLYSTFLKSKKTAPATTILSLR